jgi:hypothetical protein
MIRIVVRNLIIMLGVALPILLVSGLLVGWVFAPARAGAGGRFGPSPTAFVAYIMFLYPIWVLPALGVAAIHQVVLAAVPRNWPARTTRLIIVGTALAIVALTLGYVASTTAETHLLPIALTLLPAVVVYGLLAQPLRARGAEETSTNSL